MANSFSEFLQNSGLYDEITISKDNITELCDLIEGKVRISAFCRECGEQRVFTMAPITFTSENTEGRNDIHSLGERLMSLQHMQDFPGVKTHREYKWFWNNLSTTESTRVIVFPFVCAMDNNHYLDYIVRTEGNTMRKIGQYPSFADLAFPELNYYRKVLDEADIKGLHKAIGLYSHGIGVGSYVYLRRVFERIIDRAKDVAVADSKFTQDVYDKSKMQEKIKMLDDYLPDVLVKNPAFYIVVSKGIHEMSEEDCLLYFPVMKEYILIILRQWEQKRKDAESEKEISASISKIASNII